MHFPIPSAPAMARPVAVAPGVLWLRMPLPFALDHVNLWLIEDDRGWALVDTGYADRRTKELWEEVFSGAMRGEPLSRLIVTHYHPDHMGLASWLTDRFGLMPEATLGEWAHGRMLSLDAGQAFVDAVLRFYRAAGVDSSLLQVAAERGNTYRSRVGDIPPAYRRIRDGEELVIGGDKWRVLVGEGHGVELACLWCEARKLLISGDQILPSISPIVGVWATEPEGDPLDGFIMSLKRFRTLPADTLVLPSHGLPFHGLQTRIDALIRHHEERLEQTLAACRDPISAYELVPVLFRRQLDTQHLFFALGESLAHLHYLMGQGALVRQAGGDGIDRFQCR